MTPTAIVLLIVAAGLHASWNLITKRNHPSAAFFLLANSVGGLLLVPVVLFYGQTLRHFPAPVWTLLVLTGFFMAVYYAALAGAYRSGDISVAYPLARSSPVIVVTVVALLLGRGHQVSGQCVGGIVLVVAGCFLIPMRRFSDFRLSNYWNPTCGLALLAAVGTSGYSIADDEALRLLRTDPSLIVGAIPLTLIYACLEALSSSLWLVLFIVPRRQGRISCRRLFAKGGNWRPAALAGGMIYLTYVLVLISLGFVSNVSYVVAFRQLSIPLGAMLGIALLKEPRDLPKLVGVAIMFAGLVLVGTG